MNKTDPTGLQARNCYFIDAGGGTTCNYMGNNDGEEKREKKSENSGSDVPTLTSNTSDTPPASLGEQIAAGLKDMIWDRANPAVGIGAFAFKGIAFGVAKVSTNLHHSWPKYLGGPAQQSLVKLDAQLHRAYHTGLDLVAPRWKGTQYYQNMDAVSRQQILTDFASYTQAFDAKYGTSLFNAAVDNGFKVVP